MDRILFSTRICWIFSTAYMDDILKFFTLLEFEPANFESRKGTDNPAPNGDARPGNLQPSHVL